MQLTVDYEGIATSKEGKEWLSSLTVPFYFITTRFPGYKRYEIEEAEKDFNALGTIYVFPFESKVQWFNNNSVVHISANPADVRLIKHTPSKGIFFHGLNFDIKWKSHLKKVL